MQKVAVYLFICIAFLFTFSYAGAQDNTPIPDQSPPINQALNPECQYDGYNVSSVKTGSCLISESDFVVKLVFTEVSPLDEGAYYYCLKTQPEDCDDDDLKSVPNTNSPTDKGYNASAGTITFSCLTGDGDSKLKESCDESGKNWLHAGKTYRVNLFNKNKASLSNHVRDASFYIARFYPHVDTIPAKGAAPSFNANAAKEGKVNLTVLIEGRNLKKGDNDDKYNDYWIQVVGHDNDYISPEGCVYVSEGAEIGKTDLALPYNGVNNNGAVGKLTAGSYKLIIKDGTNGNESVNDTYCKEGDFTYFHIPFSIGVGGNEGEIGGVIPDPFGKETGIKGLVPTPAPICPESDQDENGYCERIPTALGLYIHTDPRLFVRDLFTIVLSIGGILAIVFFIQAGYKLMNSAGSKEKVGEAREQITSAIMGLIFIILSITILEFIGINILRIPGFGN